MNSLKKFPKKIRQINKKLLEEFREYMRKDERFVTCKYDFERKRYADKFFQENSKAAKFRVLFGFDEINEYQQRAGQTKLQNELERLYYDELLNNKKYSTNEYKDKIERFKELVRRDMLFWKYDTIQYRKDYARNVFQHNFLMKKYRTLFYPESDVRCESEIGQTECFWVLQNIYSEGRGKI